MNDIKIETDRSEYFCRGCLSVNRNLKILTRNIDMYFMLLGQQKPFNDSKIFNVLLCWECIALLKRMKAFQRQIQKAQCELEKWLHNELSKSKIKETLSVLKVTHKRDYDAVFEEKPQIEVKLETNVSEYLNEENMESDVSKECLNEENIVELEASKDYFDEKDIKEESIDISEPESIDNNFDDIKDETVEADSKLKKKPKDRFAGVVVTKFDLSKAENYISVVTYSLKELEVLRKEKKEWFKNMMATRLKAKIKKGLDIRKFNQGDSKACTDI